MRSVSRVISVGFVVISAGIGGAYAQFGPQVFSARHSETAARPAPTTLSAPTAVAPSNLPPTISSISTGPALTVPGLDQQLGINNQDLEISNIRLGKVPTESTRMPPVGSMKLASVATHHTFHFQPPKNPNSMPLVSGMFSLDPSSSLKPNGAEIRIASTNTDRAVLNGSFGARQLLPTFPTFSSGDHLAFSVKLTGISARLEKHDGIRHRPVDNFAHDQSPFGTPCQPTIQPSLLTGAWVQLEISAPCHPNAKVVISHGSLEFTKRASHTGALRVLVPALNQAATFSATFPSGLRLKAAISVPDVKTVLRVAVLWDGDFDVDLHAFEFGATAGSRGHVSAKNTRSVTQSGEFGGGYITVLGDDTIFGAKRAEVYTLPISDKTPTGAVRMAVRAFATDKSCGTDTVLSNIRSEGGRVVAASGVRFALPECGKSFDGLLVKHAVNDIISRLD